MKALLLLSAIAAASAAPALNAQVTPAKPDSGCTTDSDGHFECRIVRGGAPGDSMSRNRVFRFDGIGAQARYKMDSAMAKRAALGLELRTTGTRRDTLGVFVEAVTPKGPAETAGIIEGDRIASINGVDLRTAAGDTEDSYANGLAAHRLSREVQKLTPGARANLRVYSGGRFRDVQVTAGKASEVMGRNARFNFMTPEMNGMMEFDGPEGMMFAPDMQMMRERLEPLMKRRMEPLSKERMEQRSKERVEPMTKERIEPLMRRLDEMSPRIRIRAPVRVRSVAPVRVQRTYRVDATDVEPVSADEVRELVATAVDPVSADEIRELVATTIRDAQSALKQLAADGMS
jgi:HAMP domain-containing protein